MNKIIYTKPEIEIVLFEEDIMTANPSNVSFGDSEILDGEADNWRS